jgi:tetratricopeptide (TPR) repeat protein
LQVLLKAKGINSQSVLLNGGGSYTVTEIATFTGIDHVITYVPQFNLYLDSTAQVAPFGILPIEEYGKPMVIASLAAARFGKMPLLPPGLAKINFKMVAALDKDGTITGTSTTTATGPYAIALRNLGMAIQAAGPNAAKSFLAATGNSDASGTFTQGSPIGFEPDFAISGTFKASGWSNMVTGKNSFDLPGEMRLLGLPGDDVMGPFNPGNMKSDEPTLCFSVEQTDDMSLKAPPGSQFSNVPKDLRVETPNLLFETHWTLTGDTLSVHRVFTSNVDQPFCSGAVRTRSAAALKQISESYDTNISFVRPDAMTLEAKALAALYASGSAHYDAHEYDQAIADFSKVIELTPDDGQAYYSRGRVEASMKKLDLAISDFI